MLHYLGVIVLTANLIIILQCVGSTIHRRIYKRLTDRYFKRVIKTKLPPLKVYGNFYYFSDINSVEYFKYVYDTTFFPFTRSYYLKKFKEELRHRKRIHKAILGYRALRPKHYSPHFNSLIRFTQGLSKRRPYNLDYTFDFTN